MQDIQLYIDKLHVDAEACMAISQTASSEAKRKVFTALADTYRKLASEMERIAAATPCLTKSVRKICLG